MSLFKKLFSSEGTGLFKPSAGFDSLVKKAIPIIAEQGRTLEDNELLLLLEEHQIPKAAAIEIIIFLPIAFVRKLLPKVNWPGSYIRSNSKKESIETMYANTPVYNIIWKVADEYFKPQPDKDIVSKIAGRSAEFQAIRKLLQENPSFKPEDVRLSKMVFMW